MNRNKDSVLNLNIAQTESAINGNLVSQCERGERQPIFASWLSRHFGRGAASRRKDWLQSRRGTDAQDLQGEASAGPDKWRFLRLRLIAKEAEVEHLRSKLASSQDSATDARRTAVDGTGKVYMEAGSQLIAHFVEDMNHGDALKIVTEVVEETLGTSNVYIEVAKGCTKVYITFITFQMAKQDRVHEMLGKLTVMRAKLTYAEGFEGQSGVLVLQPEGQHLRWMKLGWSAYMRYAGLVSLRADAEATTLILVQGRNLLRSGLTVQYRISPPVFQTAKLAALVSDDLLRQWGVKYLTDEQDSLTVQVPPEVLVPGTVAKVLTLEFWQGTVLAGKCELPIRSIIEGKHEQERELDSRKIGKYNLRPDYQLHHYPAPAAAAERAKDAPTFSMPASVNSREFQLAQWNWDVFISHAGEDKRFGRSLYLRLEHVGLRCFLDEETLQKGTHAPEAMEAAVRSTQIAVVLLSEEFFKKKWPLTELRWFLAGRPASRHTILPVFLGVTTERCQKLAAPLGLAEVCNITGICHKGELCLGIPVTLQTTLVSIVQSLCVLTGVQYREMQVE